MNRKLGSDGPQLFPIGLGCMGMSEGYGEHAERDEQESIATIHRALDIGANFRTPPTSTVRTRTSAWSFAALQAGTRRRCLYQVRFRSRFAISEKAAYRWTAESHTQRDDASLKRLASRLSTCGICIAPTIWPIRRHRRCNGRLRSRRQVRYLGLSG